MFSVAIQYWSEMPVIEEGDRVRIDIPTRDDPDFEIYHDRVGEVVGVWEDAAGEVTGDSRDARLFQIEFDNGTTHDFRWRDLRPAPDL